MSSSEKHIKLKSTYKGKVNTRSNKKEKNERQNIYQTRKHYGYMKSNSTTAGIIIYMESNSTRQE